MLKRTLKFGGYKMETIFLDSFIEGDIKEIIGDKKITWNKYKQKTFFITGATGLIGSLVVKTLSYLNIKYDFNIRVIAQIRNKYKAYKVFEEILPKDSNIIFCIQDINNSFQMDDKIDYIIHCASITSSKNMIKYPVETLLTTIQGTKNMLELANEKKVKSMVFISSMEVYGRIDQEEKVTENNLGYIDILNKRSSYSEGKRVAECMSCAFFEEYGVPVKIARLAQTFGPGVDYHDNRIFAQFAKSLIKNENLVLHTTGNSVGNYCYTADTIRGIFYILEYGENSNAYTIVNEKNTMRIREMAYMLIEKFSKKNLSVVFDIPEENIYGYSADTNMHLSGEKMKKLGWTAKYDLFEMYDRMINSWRI